MVIYLIVYIRDSGAISTITRIYEPPRKEADTLQSVNQMGYHLSDSDFHSHDRARAEPHGGFAFVRVDTLAHCPERIKGLYSPEESLSSSPDVPDFTAETVVLEATRHKVVHLLTRLVLSLPVYILHQTFLIESLDDSVGTVDARFEPCIVF